MAQGCSVGGQSFSVISGANNGVNQSQGGIMRIIESLAALKELAGQEVAVSDWIAIAQERVNLFAQATGDDQWIHVDVERSRRESPFGGTVAHGFLTLSLLPMLLETS